MKSGNCFLRQSTMIEMNAPWNQRQSLQCIFNYHKPS